MEKILFDPKITEYKSPFGAIKQGQSFKIKIKVTDEYYVYTAKILLKKDSSDRSADVFDLSYIGNNSGYNTFGADVELEEIGLYFYSFVIDTNCGVFTAKMGEHSRAAVGEQYREWPLFVYDKNFSTPDFIKGGVIYQIFPDRFYKSNNAVIGEPKDERIIHQNWDEKPYSVYDYPGYKCNDYFMGNLKGITEKLDYIKSLGVTVIYLNPIFESAENHRYCTGDYFTVDPYLGSNEDFSELCNQAQSRGISVIIDGVFSHTGADSRYFNRFGHYDSVGAYNSPDSEYYNWYSFSDYPEKYDCWWGFKTLPNVNELEKSYVDFICSDNGVLHYWIKMGAKGIRLDVADELPDEFMAKLRKSVKSADENAVIIGEVWENGVLKESYGARRKFLEGKMCDSLMNYPFKNAVIDLIKTKNALEFADAVTDITSLYPKPALDAMMNFLSTHDTVRIINEFGADRQVSREESGKYELSLREYERGRELSLIAAGIIYTLPGNPSVFYGDEAGVNGFYDPFCRMPFAWDNIDETMLEKYKRLGKMRSEYKEDFLSDIEFKVVAENLLCYRRGRVKTYINLSGEAAVSFEKLLYFAGCADVYESQALLRPLSVVVCI